jgi:hypothetical protein
VPVPFPNKRSEKCYTRLSRYVFRSISANIYMTRGISRISMSYLALRVLLTHVNLLEPLSYDLTGFTTQSCRALWPMSTPYNHHTYLNKSITSGRLRTRRRPAPTVSYLRYYQKSAFRIATILKHSRTNDDLPSDVTNELMTRP